MLTREESSSVFSAEYYRFVNKDNSHSLSRDVPFTCKTTKGTL
jgi:hypothetical protein